ncbi:MAG: alpha/beta hydrolase [Parvularculaceae bacterium]|jgi:pimeloyl-ACP methyl ester carboxylesterase|nr:alpha/beta hydrolase [Parvularculaceae bacterium]
MIPLDDWRGAARVAMIGGYRIAWWADGEQDDNRPNLLLIHGYPTSSWDWTAMWRPLSAHFRLIAADMLGFGLSDKPKTIGYSILAQADLQEALLAQAGLAEAHILAHDYGDTVAQELLARQNEGSLSFLIRSVCFLNGGLFPEQHRARPIQKFGLSPLGPLLSVLMSKDRLRAGLDEIFGPRTKASDAEIDAHWTMINEKGGRFILHKLLHYIPERIARRDRWVGALKNAKVPLRLIDGGADPVSGAHLYAYYREQIPNADAALLPEIGHYPQTEAPAETLRLFLEFHRKMRTLAA